MGYNEENVLNKAKGFKICKLLALQNSYPKKISQQLDYSEGTVRNILTVLRSMGLVYRVESKEKSRLQFYSTDFEGIADYMIGEYADEFYMRPGIEQALAKSEVGDVKELVETIQEAENMLEKNISEENREELIETIEELKSNTGHMISKYRIDDEKMVEIYESSSLSNIPGIELDLVRNGYDPFGIEDFLEDYVEDYLCNIEDSSLDRMFHEDFEKEITVLALVLEKNNTDFEPINIFASVIEARMLRDRRRGEYRSAFNAYLANKEGIGDIEEVFDSII